MTIRTSGACAEEGAAAGRPVAAAKSATMVGAALVVALAGGTPALAQQAAAQGAPAVQTLGPVTVTATGTPESTLTAPAFTTVITSEDLKKEGVASSGLPEILGRSVGVNDRTDATGRDEVVIRGMGANYSLVLVNGRRVSTSDALWRGGDFDYHSIPMSAIERVEVVRGPLSSLYGSDAIGGVVNIITKKPTDKWSGEINGDYRVVEPGRGGTQYRTGLYAAGPIVDKVSASVSAEYFNRQAWYDDSRYNGVVPVLEKKNLANLLTTLAFDVTENQTLEANYGLNRDNRPRGYYDRWLSSQKQEIVRNTFGAAHRGNWGWGDTLVEANYEDGRIDDFNSSFNAPQQRHLKEKNLFLHGRSNFQLGFNRLTAGAEYRKQTVEDPNTFLQSGKSEIGQKAVYLQDQIGLIDGLTLTVGTRYDHHEIFGGNFTSRANVVYALTDALSLKAGVSQGYKAPDAYQLSREYRIVSCGGRCFLSGNPDLEPETSTNYEIGLETRYDRWDGSVVLFHNKVKDMIQAVYDPVAVARNWSNINNVDISGVEVTGSVSLTPKLLLSGNYTYLYTEQSNGAELDYRPRHKINASLTWQALDNISTSVSTSYTGPQLQGTSKMPGYTLLNWGVSADVTEALTVGAGVKNITDVILSEKNVNFTSVEVGRNYYVSANYRF
ncbi:outer membrane receptor for ferrienterochelin and colicins [Azospirillum baldaniorum]|uniref:TonB-dependent receptor plug domain-containing protein n=1 Tax=Azospirillum baldaniorum TaxID=1064539 RepID=UPI0011ADDE70|nr:TonB-dependent receptor [Azospirillum baldaniorum]TWA56409.1 outer membrane receptor for ferrienterochelin and colicins [Azospirillum baldaniorum]